MLRALADAGFTAVESFNRASMRAFEGAVPRAHTLIVCSGAPHAWLTLPAADGTSRCSTSAARCSSSPRRAGSSRRSMSCWTAMARCCRKTEYAALEVECADGAERICQTLLAPPPSDTLAAMTAMRTEFMQNKLPALLEGMPPQRARKLTSEVNAMLHQFISAARREP